MGLVNSNIWLKLILVVSSGRYMRTYFDVIVHNSKACQYIHNTYVTSFAKMCIVHTFINIYKYNFEIQFIANILSLLYATCT